MEWHVPIEATRTALAAAREPYVQPFAHGSLRCVLFAPLGEDTQTPHRQDELYVVSRGTAVLVRDGERAVCVTGDALFVPAGMAHRFVELSDDFECWAIFWGPAGGEA